MRACHCIVIWFILSVVSEFMTGTEPIPRDDSIGEGRNRRVLHQPLFPLSSTPPPEYEGYLLIPPPPPPPPADDTDFPYQDQPFSHEFPQVGPMPDQGQQSPSLPASGSGTAVANPASTETSKSTRKVGVIIASVVLTLGMLAVLLFYLYKNRGKHLSEARKHDGNETSQGINEESRMPASSVLCVQMVEPAIADEANGTSASASEGVTKKDSFSSPYCEVNSRRGSGHDSLNTHLQTLPLLAKLPPPPSIHSPPPMSSSDDDNHDNSFYNPKRMPMSSVSPSPRHSYLSDNTSQRNHALPDNRVVNSVPHSKRTSPRSRFSSSSSSPDTKTVMIPSIMRSLSPSSPPSISSLGPQQPRIAYTPKWAKFSSPPPPPDRDRLRSLSNDEQKTFKISIPNPPPPPPLPPPLSSQMSISKKPAAMKTYKPFPVSNHLMRSQPNNLSPKTTPSPAKMRTDEVNKEANSSEKDDIEDMDGSKPKLMPLHWDKVPATSDTGTVWDQLKSSSFRLNEDAMESLFGHSSGNPVRMKATTKFVLPSFDMENRVLDSRKSQNIAILLRALNVTREEVCEALLDGNPEGLGPELFETLVKMAPTKEEEIKLNHYSETSSKLGPAERFLKAVLDIPFAFKRVEAMLYRANFDTEVKYLRKSFQTLEEASEELKNSRLFLKLLEAVLTTGNRMNDGTYRGDAKAFKLDTLLKLVDIKGTDGKTTLLHFVVQEIIRSEGTSSYHGSDSLLNRSASKFDDNDFKKHGLQVVAGLGKELGNVKKAAGMDSDVLSSYASKLEMGLQKVKQVLQFQDQSMEGNFFDSTKMFLKESMDEISKVKAEERKALSLVKEVTHYFHGDTAKHEAHPLKIFMIVRDFLSILDNVCKDVGRMQDRTGIGSGRSFRISANAPLPVLSRYSLRNDRSSDDDNDDDDESM